NQNCSSHFTDAQIHPATLVVEDPQAEQLLNHVIGRSIRVRTRNAEQHQQPSPDRSHNSVFNANAGFGDSLDDGAHGDGRIKKRGRTWFRPPPAGIFVNDRETTTATTHVDATPLKTGR